MVVLGVVVLVVAFVASLDVIVSTIATDVGVASVVDDLNFVVAATMIFFIGI